MSGVIVLADVIGRLALPCLQSFVPLFQLPGWGAGSRRWTQMSQFFPALLPALTRDVPAAEGRAILESERSRRSTPHVGARRVARRSWTATQTATRTMTWTSTWVIQGRRRRTRL